MREEDPRIGTVSDQGWSGSEKAAGLDFILRAEA